MDAKEVIRLLKDWVKHENGRDLVLDSIEQAILEYSLEGMSYNQMSDYIPNYDLTYISHVKAPKLFKRLREETKKQVNKKNCKLVLTELLQPNNEQIAVRINNHLPHIDLNQAPEINDFYGRKKELDDLQKWLVTEGCRVVEVLGISGIGKSSLVRELVENIQKNFDYVIWKNLEKSPSLEKILTDIEHYFPCNNSETNIDNRIENLIRYLNQHRCLLIFDQWDGVIGTSEAAENYGRLLTKIGTLRHKSCLVFTSSQRPKEMDSLVRQTIKQLSLCGLENKDAKTLLKDLKLLDPGMDTLIEKYQGHPLALILASGSIQNVHNGKINKFLEGTLFVSNALLTLLDKLNSNLPNLERKIIQKLVTETEPKSLSQIYQYFPSSSESEVSEAINKLWQVRIIEKGDIQESQPLWILNPLIEKYFKRRDNSTILKAD